MYDIIMQLLLAIGLFALGAMIVLLVFGLCQTSAPQTDEEQTLDNEEQIKYLRSLNEKYKWE